MSLFSVAFTSWTLFDDMNILFYLQTVRLGQKGYLDVIEQAISAGDTVLIENLGETIDPVLDPLLGRNTIKKVR